MQLNDVFSQTIEMQNPILRDEEGNLLARFDTASILLWQSGNKELSTAPKALQDDFPFHLYIGRQAAPLYLCDGKEEHRVILIGGVLRLA